MKESKTKGNGGNGKTKRKRMLILVLIFIFLYNIVIYLINEGSYIQILSILFNIIFILGLVIFFLHKEEIIDENIEIQTTLKKYFKKDKNNSQKKLEE